jgi:hypothetical protein
LKTNPWEERSEQAFWIGQSTSIDWDTFPQLRLANYYVYEGEFSLLNDDFWQLYKPQKQKYPRLNLVEKSLENPSMLNASFSSAFTEVINFLKVEHPSE